MKLRKKTKTYLQVITVGGLWTLLMTVFYLIHPMFFSHMDYKIYDSFLLKAHNPKTSGTPIIVDLDEESLKKFGQWPWPRYRVAKLLEKITQAGVASVGLDIQFSEPDRTSPIAMKQNLEKDLNVDVNFSGIPSELMDNDQVFADILKKGNYILSYSFQFIDDGEQGAAEIQNDTKDQLHPVNVTLIKPPDAIDPLKYLWHPKSVAPPLPILNSATKGAGFMNALPDPDGIIRGTPLLMVYRGKVYPSLSLATLNAALGVLPISLKSSVDGVDSIKIGKTIVPLDKTGRMQLHFRGPRKTFKYYSASLFLEDKFKPGSLAGKIAFIGTSASGLKDIRSIPFDPLYPGVETHATVVDNILVGDFFSIPDWARPVEFFMVLAFGIISTLLMAMTGAKFSLPLTVFFGLGMWYGSYYIFEHYRYFLSPLFPLLSLAGNFSLSTATKFWITEKEKRFFREAFSRYVSKAVVEQITESPDLLRLEGEEKEMSILFADIRSFTSLSEKLTPTQIIDLLHDYFTPMTRVITNNKGTLDKFIGDSIMAFWNAPVDVKDHKELAMKTGVEMLKELGILNKTFVKNFGFELNIGIGLHTGNVHVGNIGTKDLFDYTIIGDAVNLTSRLESLSKYYGVRIIISEAIRSVIPEGFIAQELDLVRVKGKTNPVKLFGLYSGYNSPDPEKEIRIYQEALYNYQEKNFKEALKIFQKLSCEYIDRKLYELYQKRCTVFIETPPPREWDGVWVHRRK